MAELSPPSEDDDGAALGRSTATGKRAHAISSLSETLSFPDEEGTLRGVGGGEFANTGRCRAATFRMPFVGLGI
eukprot:11209959-Lingulodinium_polyedra.AAC.1